MVTAKQQHHHPVEWRAPGPLWSLALQDGTSDRLFAPQLLRFDMDEFMQRLTAALATENGSDLQNLVLRAETWEEPAVGWQPLADANAKLPKLYHPAHARFYLVAASLVCKLPGLPDRAPHGEKVTFVLRQLRPLPAVKGQPTTYQEEGWVPGQGWVLCTDPLKLLASEEQQPLFPVTYIGDGKTRRLHCGLVPVASRDVQKPTGDQAFPIPQVTGPTAEGWSALEGGEEDPRLVQLRAQVLVPLDSLPLATFTTTEAYEASAFILYDLAVFLRDQMNDVWTKVQAGDGTGSTLATEILTKLVDGTNSWGVALQNALNAETALLAGNATGLAYDLRVAQAIDWATRVPAEITTYVPPTSLPEGTITQVPKFMPNGKERFVIRCVYQKPNCKIHEAVLSKSTRPFKIASFFDPDAPVRPVKVIMPTDTSIAGLRRFQKGVSFVVSHKLRNQMEKFRGIKMSDLDDGNLGSSGNFSWGMICSFSIPIITICALILLFIIVQLLNIVFFWIPFLKICFPVPLPAKEE